MVRAPQNEATIYNELLRMFISLEETAFGNNDKPRGQVFLRKSLCQRKHTP
jgi:hypothetical protein